MFSFYKKIAIALSFAIVFSIFFPSKTQAALTQQFDTTLSYQKVDISVCQGYSNFVISCNNGPAPGNPGGCGTNICTGGNVWTQYTFTQCYADVFPGDYIEVLDTTASSCSTADKYNLASYGSGDTTMLRSGSCSCLPAQGLYKTCCNGTTPMNTYNYTAISGQGNPNYPDGACAYTVVNCGSGTPYNCGQDACNSLATPTPTPAPTGCTGVLCSAGYTPTCSNPSYPNLISSLGYYKCYDPSYSTCVNAACLGATPTPGCPTTNGYTGQSCTAGSAPQPLKGSCTTCGSCTQQNCIQYSTNLWCWNANTSSSACVVNPSFCNSVNSCTHYSCINNSCQVDPNGIFPDFNTCNQNCGGCYLNGVRYPVGTTQSVCTTNVCY